MGSFGERGGRVTLIPTSDLAHGSEASGTRIDLPDSTFSKGGSAVAISRSRIHILVSGEKEFDLVTLSNGPLPCSSRAGTELVPKELIELPWVPE